MKNTIRTLAAAVAILFLFAMCSLLASAQQTESPKALQWAQYDENYIAEAKARTAITLPQEIKELLKEAVLNTQASVDVSSYKIPYSAAYLQAVGDYLYDEVPEAFHLNHISCQYYASGSFATFRFTYDNTASEYAQMLAQCNLAADKLLNGIQNNNALTDVEKALLVHDRLALHCAYGDVYADSSETATIYAALIGRRPVCQGYAEAYMFLLQKIGIECSVVSSEALNHAWNIVYINGKPYHVDVTWDDPTGDIYGRVGHTNFLLSTNALKAGIGGSKPHNAEDFDTSPVDTTYDNAYWQSSEAAFQLIDGEIFYIDNAEQKIKRASDRSVLCSVDGIWRVNSSSSYVQGNFARLASVNSTLLCSLPTAVYSIDLKTGSKTEFCKPTLEIDGEKFYSIFGFAYENGMLLFDYCNLTANGYISTKKTSVTAPAVACEHQTTEKRNAAAATCGKDGYTGDIYCTGCDKLLTKGSTIPAHGNHSWNKGTITKAASCCEEGVRFFTCTVCTATKTAAVSLNPANHDGEEKTVGQLAATCGKDGYTGDIYCTGCDKLLTEGSTIPANGNHNWNAGIITREPTAEQEGIKTYTCTVCTQTKEEKLPITEIDSCGDIDGDGRVTSSDARLALRASAGLEALEASAAAAADVDNDNAVTAADARFILRFAVGLEKKWPVKQ